MVGVIFFAVAALRRGHSTIEITLFVGSFALIVNATFMVAQDFYAPSPSFYSEVATRISASRCEAAAARVLRLAISDDDFKRYRFRELEPVIAQCEDAESVRRAMEGLLPTPPVPAAGREDVT